MGDNSTIKIPQEQMQQLIGAAVAQLMDDKMKGDIIAQAVSWLTQPSNYGKSPLTESFEAAVRKVADNYLTVVLEGSPEFKEQVEWLARESLKGWLENADSKILDEAKKGILKAISDSNRW